MTPIIRSIKEAFSFIGEHGVLKSLHAKDSPWLIQFGKYGMCGVIAVVMHSIINYSLGLTILPSVGEGIDKDVKQHNLLISNSIAFFGSGIVAYWLNVTFVFTPGRHGKSKEISLFFIISAIAFFAGLLAIPLVFKALDTNKGIEHFANLGFIITSAMVNFLCRKFVIFKG
jgi:putative flippase GtrA